MDEPHPTVLVVEDDLRRSRPTVFFRLLLAIPHFVWVALWTIAVVVLAVVAWVIALFTGTLPAGLHRFFCSYIRYVTRLSAYLYLVANPYPQFTGDLHEGYPLDVRLPDEPARLSRWRVLVRLVIAIPSLLVASTLTGASFSAPIQRSNRHNSTTGLQASGVGAVAAILGWFAILGRGRMPRGLRDSGAYSIGYQAQLFSYLLFVTERYPSADPHRMLAGLEPPPPHPVHIEGDALDLRRSRLTVFFRLPLVIPHLVWLVLWTIPAVLAVILQWFATLALGWPAQSLHRFLSRYVRYAFHVYAFGALAANPFPGFTGRPGVYPLDLVLPDPGRQSRWKTLFRIFLVIPAFLMGGALGGALIVSAILTWFAALATGRAPEGLRNLEAWALRYAGQTNAYLYLLTDRYPHASPLEGFEAEVDGTLEPAAPPELQPEPVA